MKVLAIILAALFALDHPAATAVVLASVLAVSGGAAWLAWRASRPARPCPRCRRRFA